MVIILGNERRVLNIVILNWTVLFCLFLQIPKRVLDTIMTVAAETAAAYCRRRNPKQHEILPCREY